MLCFHSTKEVSKGDSTRSISLLWWSFHSTKEVSKGGNTEEKDIKTALFSDQRSLVFKSGKQFRLKFRSSL
mgnify:CR=1 FL=1